MLEHVRLRERVAKIFSETMNVEVPSVDTDLFESGALDSLGFVDLVVRLEEEFGIQVPVAEVGIDNFRTIARMAAYVAARNGNDRS